MIIIVQFCELIEDSQKTLFVHWLPEQVVFKGRNQYKNLIKILNGFLTILGCEF